MNMKQLRRIHRDKFTKIVETKIGKDEVERVRVKRDSYIPFKVWLRTMKRESDDSRMSELTGKALEIRGGGL